MRSFFTRTLLSSSTPDLSFSSFSSVSLQLLSLKAIQLTFHQPTTASLKQMRVSSSILPAALFRDEKEVLALLDAIEMDRKQSFLLPLKCVPKLTSILRKRNGSANLAIQSSSSEKDVKSNAFLLSKGSGSCSEGEATDAGEGNEKHSAETETEMMSNTNGQNPLPKELVESVLSVIETDRIDNSLSSALTNVPTIPLLQALQVENDRLRDTLSSSSLPPRPAPLPSLSDAADSLFMAVMAKKHTEMQHLLAAGVDVNVRHPSHGATALHLCAFYGDCEAMNILLDNHANINAVALNGSSALHWAAGSGQLEATRLLLQRGCNALLTTRTWHSSVTGQGSGQTAASWASESGHVDIVRLLGEFAPGSLALSDERGKTPIDLAEKEAQTSTVSFLKAALEEQFASVTIELVGRANRMNSPSKW